MQVTQQSAFSVCMFVRLLTASVWLKYTHNLSNMTKLILLDILLQDVTAGETLIATSQLYFKIMHDMNLEMIKKGECNFNFYNSLSSLMLDIYIYRNSLMLDVRCL